MKKHKHNSGFSLVELLVAIAIFSIVALMGTTAVLVVIASNRTSQSVSEVLSNFSLALEAMSRNIRVGSYYHCGDYPGISLPAAQDPSSAQDCSVGVGGADNMSFLSEDNQTWFTYFLQDDGNGNKSIYKAVDGIDQGAITAPEISVDTLKFYVIGAQEEDLAAPDRLQPYVIMVISGFVDNGTKGKVPFNIQTTVSQRLLR